MYTLRQQGVRSAHRVSDVLAAVDLVATPRAHVPPPLPAGRVRGTAGRDGRPVCARVSPCASDVGHAAGHAYTSPPRGGGRRGRTGHRVRVASSRTERVTRRTGVPYASPSFAWTATSSCTTRCTTVRVANWHRLLGRGRRRLYACNHHPCPVSKSTQHHTGVRPSRHRPVAPVHQAARELFQAGLVLVVEPAQVDGVQVQHTHERLCAWRSVRTLTAHCRSAERALRSQRRRKRVHRTPSSLSMGTTISELVLLEHAM